MSINNKENVPNRILRTYSGRRRSKKLGNDGTPLTVSDCEFAVCTGLLGKHLSSVILIYVCTYLW